MKNYILIVFCFFFGSTGVLAQDDSSSEFTCWVYDGNFAYALSSEENQSQPNRHDLRHEENGFRFSVSSRDGRLAFLTIADFRKETETSSIFDNHRNDAPLVELPLISRLYHFRRDEPGPSNTLAALSCVMTSYEAASD